MKERIKLQKFENDYMLELEDRQKKIEKQIEESKKELLEIKKEIKKENDIDNSNNSEINS